MEPEELLAIAGRGEDSSNEFKVNLNNAVSAAEEIAAFSNSLGGYIFVGVTDDGEIVGLSTEDVKRINKLLDGAASENVRPSVTLHTENIEFPQGLVMVVTVREGSRKPYFTTSGKIFVRTGTSKKTVNSPEELRRIYQSSRLINGDEIPANGLTPADLDVDYFRSFYESKYGESLDAHEFPLPQLLENMNLVKEGTLNVACALLFTQRVQFYLPAFIVKAVSYPGHIIDEEKYLGSRDIEGKLVDVFQQTISFVINYIRDVQGKGNVNAQGEPEIPRIVLEEIIVNALIHRDYFVSAPIRIFIFSNQIEIISPGHLPNNLTIENIKNGNSNIRNPVLASFATKILPYRGLGNGIRRALQAYPNITFTDDHEGNLFKVIIARNNQ